MELKLNQTQKKIIVFIGIGILIIGGFTGAFFSFYGPLSNFGGIAPEISSYSPIINPILTQEESYDFTLTASDPEGGYLSYTWLLDGVDQGVMSSYYTYSAGHISPGIHSVIVEVSDGWKISTQAWNLTILDLQLLGDFNNNTEDADIAELYNADGTLYFSANDEEHGIELWMYDSSGVRMVKDINPGFSNSDPTDFGHIGNTVYFTATNALNSRGLYRTDGTSEGTELVNDTITASKGSGNSLGVLGDVVAFSGSNSTNGNELYAYNHTSDEMYLIEDIYPGATSSTPYSFTLFKDELYFVAYDNVYGNELFKTDGSTVSLVIDVNQGMNGGLPTTLTPSGENLFFLASNSTIGRELFVTNGSETNLVKDIYPGSSTSNGFWLTDVNGTLFFRARDSGTDMELWKSDGSEGGTIRVKDIFPGSSRSYINTIVNYNGTAFFGAYDGNTSIGRELWKSDGTEIGTVLAADVNLADSSYPDRLTVAGDKLYFSAYSTDLGHELYTYHPSEGAKLCEDIASGPASSNIDHRILECNGSLLVVLDDVYHGEELWKSQGTTETTSLLLDINIHTQSFSPKNFVELNEKLYFQGNDGIYGRELWETDGTNEGTKLLHDIEPGYQSSSPDNIIRLGNKLYFTAYTEQNGSELYKYDPITNLVSMVMDINPGQDSSDIDSISVIGDLMWFTTYLPANGSEPWLSDGTTAGTRILHDIEDGDSSAPEQFTQVGDYVYFYAFNSTYGWKIWKANIDGTVNIEDFIIDVDPGEIDPSIEELTVVGKYLCFSIDNSSTGNELGILDTTDDSITIYDIEEGGSGSDPELLTEMGGDLYFAAYNTTYEHELWKWDSETDLVTLVKDIQIGESAEIRSLIEMNGVLYFSATNDTYGWEIYRSDGTEAGTYILKDINPGTNHSRPFEFVVVYDHLFFIAAVDGSNYELWKTNGLPEYTNVVEEEYFNVHSHDFNVIMGFNGMIILTGDNGFHGSEIHIA